MSAEEILRSTEEQAEDNITPSDEQATSEQIKFTGKGRNFVQSKIGMAGKIKKFGAVGFVTVALLVFLFIFGSGNLIPAAISNRLLEETDVQYAYGVRTKELVFQEALREGDIPDNTTEILQSNGVLVGYTDSEGNFVETNQHEGGLELKMGDEVIPADQFVSKTNSNARLYDAFNKATYSRAAGWFDDSAEEVMKMYGTNRNNYTTGKSFEEVMSEKMGSGNDLDIDSSRDYWYWECEVDENNNRHCWKVFRYDEKLAQSLNTDDASSLVNNVAKSTRGANEVDAALNTADELKVADTVANEQRSGTFYLLIMENISMMQAGDGNQSQINEMMNYLYSDSTNKVVDVETGETIEVKGSAMDSPSLYAILSGNKLDVKEMQNYSNDRILKTIENKTNKQNKYIDETVASTDNGVKGAIGRFYDGIHNDDSGRRNMSANDEEMFDGTGSYWDGKDENTIIGTGEIINTITPTVNNSLVENSFEDISGVNAGEMLAEGAVNVGKELAKYSGATAGDEQAVAEYARLTADVLAMDAKADRLNRSPFDVTSKNTFLGSIMYKLAIGLSLNTNNSVFSGVSNFMGTVASSVASLFGVAHAEDSETGYLTNFGDCETLATIGAMGSPQCTMVATFDTSTLDDPFNNPDYLNFVNENVDNGSLIGSESNLIASTNTVAAVGGSSVKNNSKLAKFIKNNIRRITPVGITDGGIIDSYDNDTSESDKIPVISNVFDLLTKVKNKIANWIKALFGDSNKDEKERAATGELYTNSSQNEDWETYKFAQLYVGLARSQEQLRAYAVNYDGRVAYNIKTLEGDRNPVIAYIREYCSDDTKIADN